MSSIVWLTIIVSNIYMSRFIILPKFYIHYSWNLAFLRKSKMPYIDCDFSQLRTLFIFYLLYISCAKWEHSRKSLFCPIKMAFFGVILTEILFKLIKNSLYRVHINFLKIWTMIWFNKRIINILSLSAIISLIYLSKISGPFINFNIII